ncbi:TPA: hypothetical protein ACJN9V_000431 [Streptococcus agalactiae]|uniref:Phage protein n=1 Tax=Streptococcus agalactiae TaxID=1311 RepID=A0AB38VMR3_STRAG|nr:hypothetical protein [Streptococcus agalactiae]HEO8207761.1 hypothetical protein [Streptococcus agalactiae ADL-350]EPT56732.1 hypothetical protein SAG0053_07410 [Streptococcus agalactiae CCUG 25532]EPT85595.1 hypothetical protein SAG0099_03460 [Streptococcus agalactiae BSU247]EPV20913.1 hypothetical protein SAG0334_05040 [Streptococcus agalactiae GB00640]EPX03650.1 hypothetical protein SAG0147_10340 [Streptococcus agalactiae MRI Z1-048]
MNEQNNKLHKQSIVIVVLTVAVSVLLTTNIALYNYYQPQITGLQQQLIRTQYRLKESSEQNQRQTKRIAELTGDKNG